MRIGLWKPSYLVQSCCYELLCSIQIPRTESWFAWCGKFCQQFKKYQTTSGFNAHNPLQEDIEYIFGNQGHYGIINAAASMLLGSKNYILLDLFYTSTSELMPSLYQWNTNSWGKHILTPGHGPTFAVACSRTQRLMNKAPEPIGTDKPVHLSSWSQTLRV